MVRRDIRCGEGRSVPSGMGDVLGTVHLLSLALDTQDFRKWLTPHPCSSPSLDVFDGHVFAWSALVRLLHQAISFDLNLGLTEDSVLIRAQDYGAPIAEIPNSCEKAILLRSIHKASRALLGSKSWDQLQSGAAAFSESTLKPLGQLSSVVKLTRPKATPDVATAVSFVGQWQTYLFLNDTHRGYPHGYNQPMLSPTPTDERLAKLFRGYKLTVQYLWWRLLDEEFAGSVVAELHTARCWREFDEYHRPIRDELIAPMEACTKLTAGFNTLLIAEPGARSVISELLIPKSEEQPMSRQKELQRKFLWYPIELVDASDAIFNGVLTFVSLLSGTVELHQRRQPVGKSKPVLVMRVKHPAREAGGHDYSYGLLLEAQGSIADYSGWLLFYDCCGDYSGFARSQYELAEREVQRHLDEKTIEVHEVTITQKDLLTLMHGKLLSTTKDVMFAAERTKSKLRGTEDELGAARGLLLELLGVHHYSAAAVGRTKIAWAYEKLGQEIDVLVRTGESLIFVECKKPEVTDPIQQVEKLKGKAATLLGAAEFCAEWNIGSDSGQIAYAFATWDTPSSATRKALNRSGADLLLLSENMDIGRRTRDRLKKALDRAG